MGRYIDAELLKVKFAKRLNNHFGIMIKIDDVAVDLGLAIADTPTADVEEVRHGHWIKELKDIGSPSGVTIKNTLVGYRCSECGRTEFNRELYCNCGAKMDGGS